MLNNEEIANSITHLIGLLLSVAGTMYFIHWGILNGSASQTMSLIVYGGTLILLYLFSSCYHLSPYYSKVKSDFQKLDHAAIYLLIAGTYAPIMVISIKGALAFAVLILVWILAILGIFLETTGLVKSKKFFLSLYIIMGWIAVFFFRKIIANFSSASLVMLILGGLFYTAGVYFYVNKKIKFNHAIWHVFVLLGSLFHYLCILNNLPNLP